MSINKESSLSVYSGKNINKIMDREKIANQIKDILRSFDTNRNNLTFKKGIYIYGGCNTTLEDDSKNWRDENSSSFFSYRPFNRLYYYAFDTWRVSYYRPVRLLTL